jgi:GNAT superfamily N-acetyltransferase
VIIRLLEGPDTRSGFSCGTKQLDVFLRRYARRAHRRFESRTWVAVVGDEVVGYATVVACHVTEGDQRRYPALRLAKLGVAKKRHGIGSALLRHVIGLTAVMRDNVGCTAIVVDALKTEEALGFYASFGFLPLAETVPGATATLALPASAIVLPDP